MRLAHRFALENEYIRADAIEVTEYPYLVAKYRVMGVPLTVINEAIFVEGAVPEPRFADEVLRALEPVQRSG